MYFSSTFTLFVLSHLATVRAQATNGFDTLTSPASGASFAVGSVLPIVWEAGSSTGTVTILLNGGPTPSTLQHLFVIGTSISSQAGGYNWTITPAVGSFATYGLNLTLDGNPITEYQESFPFHLTGGSDTSSSSSSSAISSSTSSASASAITVSGSTISGSTSTVTASTTSAASATVADLTPSGTGSTTTLTSSSSFTSTTSTPYSNTTASKTSSSKSSSTSSAASTSSSSSSSAANGGPVQFLSASVALLSACLFAFAL